MTYYQFRCYAQAVVVSLITSPVVAAAMDINFRPLYERNSEIKIYGVQYNDQHQVYEIDTNQGHAVYLPSQQSFILGEKIVDKNSPIKTAADIAVTPPPSVSRETNIPEGVSLLKTHTDLVNLTYQTWSNKEHKNGSYLLPALAPQRQGYFIIYSDPHCPFCRKLTQEYNSLREAGFDLLIVPFDKRSYWVKAPESYNGDITQDMATKHLQNITPHNINIARSLCSDTPWKETRYTLGNGGDAIDQCVRDRLVSMANTYNILSFYSSHSGLALLNNALARSGDHQIKGLSTPLILASNGYTSSGYMTAQSLVSQFNQFNKGGS